MIIDTLEHRTTRSLTSLPSLLGLLLLLSLYRLWAVTTNGLDLYVDEAYYWLWAQQPAWGYYSKPPGIAMLIAATTGLLGDSTLAVKIGALLVYPLTALLVYAIALPRFGQRVAWWAALAFFTAPGVALSATIASTDILLLFFWALALWGWLRALESNRWSDWLLTGIAAGLGLLSKYNMALFALCACIQLLLTPGLRHQFGNPRLWVAVAVAALCLLPNLLWNAAHDFPTLQHTAEISGVGHQQLRLGEAGQFLLDQAAVIGPVFYLMTLVWLWRLPRQPHARLTAGFSLPFLAVIAIVALSGEANANWAAPAIISLLIGLCAWSVQRPYWLAGAVALNLLLGSALYHFDGLVQLTGLADSVRQDPFKRVRDWDSWGEQLQTFRTEAPGRCLLSSDREVLAQAGWQLRDSAPCLASWDPDGRIHHQFDISVPLQEGDQRPFLLVERQSTRVESITGRFEHAKPLGELIRLAGTRDEARWQIWQVDHFLGYQEPL